MKDYKNENTAMAIKKIENTNGGEFRDYKALEKFYDKRTKGQRLKVYYVHPYRSCERGSNENANRLIRRFIPEIENFNLPIIIHTISEKPIQYFFSLGFDGCLKKPIKQEETIQILKNLL